MKKLVQGFSGGFCGMQYFGIDWFFGTEILYENEAGFGSLS